MGYSTLATAQVSALRSSEVSSPRSIMGSSIGGSGTVRSRGGVRATEGPLIEVSLYMYMWITRDVHLHVHVCATLNITDRYFLFIAKVQRMLTEIFLFLL